MLLWHLASTAALVALPSLLLANPAWRLPEVERRAFGILLLGFFLSGLFPVLAARRGTLLAPAAILLRTAAVFAVGLFALLLLGWVPARSLTAGLCLGGLLVIPVVGTRAASFGPLLPLAAVLLGAAVFGLRRQPGAAPSPNPLIQTALYSLELDFRPGPLPPSRVRGGGLARLGDEYLLLTGDGRLHLVAWRAEDAGPRIRTLPYRVPANADEFGAAVIPPGQAGTGAATPSAAPHWFRVALGLHATVVRDSASIYASYLYWLADRRCYVLRVATLQAPIAAFVAGQGAPPWRLLYETSPCLPPGENRFSEMPLMGHEVGGRLILLGRDSLLLSVGHAGYDGVSMKGEPLPGNPAASFGKTILIHLDGRPASVYSSGHRNPQGLHRGSDGIIWLTEHGPRGGDELNLIVAGADYGWPAVTYGTDYGTMEWLPSHPRSSHEGYQPPVHAWVPSVAVSELIRIEGSRFPAWHGDLLVGSLTDRALYRVRLEGERAAYAERIAVDRRIRSLVEGSDGRILLWTDEAAIGLLQPNRATTGATLFALRCGGCHRAADGSQHLIGPDLGGVLGRSVGSVGETSPALRALGGAWTAAKLEAFIASPNAMAPGTRMTFPGLPDAAQRKAIVDFLRTRR